MPAFANKRCFMMKMKESTCNKEDLFEMYCKREFEETQEAENVPLSQENKKWLQIAENSIAKVVMGNL